MTAIISRDPDCDKQRARWGAGPWQSEPDRLEWRTGAGFVGLIIRVPHHGALCGYVGVPPEHPWYRVHYDDIDHGGEVHGGLTYSAKCTGSICHQPMPGEPDDLWWVGFDCAHGGLDLVPGGLSIIRLFLEGAEPGLYRDVDYVTAHVERLATIAKHAAEAHP